MTQSNIKKLVRFPEAIDEARAFEIIREIAGADVGGVFLTSHAKKRMKERNVSRTQVVNVLYSSSTRMNNGPYLASSGDWKCELQGFAAGTEFGLAVAIQTPIGSGRVIVITVIV